MRICHTADWHLGFRHGERMIRGRNARECAVEQAVSDVIDLAIARDCELVVIAGDVFHAPTPPNAAILTAFRELQRLRDSRPDTTVVMVAGNHDRPRSAGTSSILPLFGPLGVYVADATWRHGPSGVLCVPDLPRGKRPEIRAIAPIKETNVCVLHGSIRGGWPGVPVSDSQYTLEELHLDEWDYVALGDYHVRTDIAPNAGYCGAIDYTSSDVWGEKRMEAERGLAGKGVIEYDTATRTRTWLPLPQRHRVVDLPPIDADTMTIEQANAAVAASFEGLGDLSDVIARLVVLGGDRTAFDYKLIRAAKARALSLTVDLRRSPKSIVAGQLYAAQIRRMSVRELLEHALERRTLPPDIDRATFTAAGLAYLDAAEEPGEEKPAEKLDASSISAAAAMPNPYTAEAAA